MIYTQEQCRKIRAECDPVSARSMINESEIRHIVHGFQKHTLPKEEWTHQAHLVNGLFYILREGFEPSITLMREGIKSYNVSVGTQNTDTGGYHESITVFFMHVLNAFRKHFQENSSLVFLVNQFDGSPLMDENLFFRFYSKERLFSVKARREWVDPDIQPLSRIHSLFID